MVLHEALYDRELVSKYLLTLLKSSGRCKEAFVLLALFSDLQLLFERLLRCEIFVVFSPLVPSKREKNILVLLSLYNVFP